jgi:hypothetical protein
MTTTQHEALAELDELIRTETVRVRHIQLVRLRGMVERAISPLDNVINSPVEPITQSDQ